MFKLILEENLAT